MIRIHRRRPLVRIGEHPVRLTKPEHELITALGMLDNRLAPREILLDVLCEGRVQIPADQEVLMVRMSRLRRKIGRDRLLCKRYQGYILIGDVRLYG